MTRFWEFFGRDAPHEHHRNLQDGLFQIASQTCSLLVQVNNTNNISYGHHSTNIQWNSLQTLHPVPPPRPSSRKHSEQDREQLLVLIPPHGKNAAKFKGSVSKKPKLGVSQNNKTTKKKTAFFLQDKIKFWLYLQIKKLLFQLFWFLIFL